MVWLILLSYRENLLKLRSFFIFPGNQLLLGSKDNNKPLERRRRWNYKGFYSLPHHEVKRKKKLVYDTELSESTNTKNLSHLGQRQPIQPSNWILHKFVYWFLPEKRLDAKNECWKCCAKGRTLQSHFARLKIEWVFLFLRRSSVKNRPGMAGSKAWCKHPHACTISLHPL